MHPNDREKAKTLGYVGNGKCLMCNHAERFRVELYLASGASAKAVHEKFDLPFSADTVWRHWQLHVSDLRKAQIVAGPLKVHELAERANEENLSLLDYLAIVRRGLVHLFQDCVDVEDYSATAQMSGRLLETLRLIGGITGELTKIPGIQTVNNNLMFYASPGFEELKQMLTDRLSRYPDARAEVLDGLRQLEHRQVEGSMQAPPPRVIQGRATEILDDL